MEIVDEFINYNDPITLCEKNSVMTGSIFFSIVIFKLCNLKDQWCQKNREKMGEGL